MNDRIDQIVFYIEQLNIRVSEEDFTSDLEEIADTISDTFWDEMYRVKKYDVAIENSQDIFDEEFENLPYIEERREAEVGWDESEDFEAFYELVKEEVFERADVPEDDRDARGRLDDDGDGDDDEAFD
jgi:CO dehydrogenase/acetyl-CoA synthase beta subunit